MGNAIQGQRAARLPLATFFSRFRGSLPLRGHLQRSRFRCSACAAIYNVAVSLPLRGHLQRRGFAAAARPFTTSRFRCRCAAIYNVAVSLPLRGLMLQGAQRFRCRCAAIYNVAVSLPLRGHLQRRGFAAAARQKLFDTHRELRDVAP